MKIYKFNQYINEDLVTDLSSKLSDDKKGVKEDIIKMISKTIDTDDSKVFFEKLDSIIRDSEESTIEGLVNDADLYEFYLKYRNDLDEILNKSGFFTKLQDFQKETNSISLYDLLVKGTKKGVEEIVKTLKQELSSGEQTDENVE